MRCRKWEDLEDQSLMSLSSSSLSSCKSLSSSALRCLERPSLEILCWYVNELECKGKDASNKSIDNGIGLKVRMVEHLLDVLDVNFYNEVLNSNDVKVENVVVQGRV